MTDLAPVVLPIHVRRGPLQLAAGEIWCADCGSDGAVWDGDTHAPTARKRCIFCGSQNLVPAVACLHAGEYVTSCSEST